MNKSFRNIIIFIGIVLVIAFVNFTSFDSEDNTLTRKVISDYPNGDTPEQKPEKVIGFYFYDNSTQCSLNGEVYNDDESLGKSENGILILKERDYKDKFIINSTLSIRGLTDNCFIKDKNLPFEFSWVLYDKEGLQEYFDNNATVSLDAALDLREPSTPYTIKGFVRPNETKDFLNKMPLSNESSQFENIKLISNYLNSRFNYVDDYDYFKKSEYFEPPF